jgi:hypothetical protein
MFTPYRFTASLEKTVALSELNKRWRITQNVDEIWGDKYVALGFCVITLCVLVGKYQFSEEQTASIFRDADGGSTSPKYWCLPTSTQGAPRKPRSTLKVDLWRCTAFTWIFHTMCIWRSTRKNYFETRLYCCVTSTVEAGCDIALSSIRRRVRC